MLQKNELLLLQHHLHQLGILSQPLVVIRPVGGGSINECYQLQAGDERFFLKWNEAARFPQMFHLEAKGLELLRNTGTIKIPEVVSHGVVADNQYLLLRWIEKGANTIAAQEKLGIKLAQLHQTEGTHFGLHFNNYMGSLTQANEAMDNCADFFISRRLQPQLKMAVDKRLISPGISKQFDALFAMLSTLIPQELPVLTHGDLWSGNYMIDFAGEPVLIDPAIAYHHRETDIALTTLFGGYSPVFYEAYKKACPLQPGWEERTDLWNLYPLLIHVNLFGYEYVGQLQECISRFV